MHPRLSVDSARTEGWWASFSDPPNTERSFAANTPSGVHALSIVLASYGRTEYPAIAGVTKACARSESRASWRMRP
jgi:hypothetical protein